MEEKRRIYDVELVPKTDQKASGNTQPKPATSPKENVQWTRRATELSLRRSVHHPVQHAGPDGTHSAINRERVPPRPQAPSKAKPPSYVLIEEKAGVRSRNFWYRCKAAWNGSEMPFMVKAWRIRLQDFLHRRQEALKRFKRKLEEEARRH